MKTLNTKQIAIHESGHCLAFYHYGIPFKYVDITGNHRHPDGTPYALVSSDFKGDSFEYLVISAAGVYAELAGGYTTETRVSTDEGTDFGFINEVIERKYGPDMLQTIHRQIMEAATTLLKRNWIKLQAIAEALEQRKFLTFDAVKNIVHQVDAGLKFAEKKELEKFRSGGHVLRFDRPTIFEGRYFDLSFLWDGITGLYAKQDWYLNDALVTTDYSDVYDAFYIGVYRVPFEANCAYDRLDVTLYETEGLPIPANWTNLVGSFDSFTSTTFSEASSFPAGAVRVYAPISVAVGEFVTYTVSITVSGTWTGSGLILTSYLTDSSGNLRSTDQTTDPTSITANGSYSIEFKMVGVTGAATRLVLDLADLISTGTANSVITIPNVIKVVSSSNAVSETKTIDINCDCLPSKATGYYLSWMANTGGFRYWLFSAYADDILDITDSGETEENIFPNWPNSYGEFADTIRKQTYRVSRKQVLIRSQHLTSAQVEEIKNIKSSPLVQIINSIYDRRTVLVDTDSITWRKEGSNLHEISFTITYTDDVPSQRV